MGVRKGDVVALCSENREEFWSTMLGVVCTGATLTPYNPLYATAEMKHILSISKPKYLICSPLTYKAHGKTFQSIGHLKRIILYGDQAFENTLLYKDLTTATSNHDTQLIVNHRLTRNIRYEEFQVVEVCGQTDILFVLYSSGTTGLPKGVMLTHYNVICACCTPSLEFTDGYTLNITSWFHAMGLIGSLIAMNRNKSYVYLAKFEVDLYMKTIENFKVEQLFLVPSMLISLCKLKKYYDVSSVKKILSGAAPLSKDISEATRRKFFNIPGVVQGYGMTECTIAITKDDYVDGKLLKNGSVGTTIAHSVLKIVDIETRKVLGSGQSGEICFKGPMVMKGYVGKDTNDDFDEEGFFRTGDIGFYDEDGYLYVVDRLKELIKYKSIQVAPAEIEAMLLQHEAVRDVGVVGVPHSEAGEVPLAFVVFQPGKTVTEELQDFIEQRLSNPKRRRRTLFSRNTQKSERQDFKEKLTCYG